jgi:hypothetical protein
MALRFRLVVMVEGRQELRLNMRPENLVRNGQDGERDVVEVPTARPGTSALPSRSPANRPSWINSAILAVHQQ